MAKNKNDQDTRNNRHNFDDDGPDFDPNDPSQMPDGSPFPAGLMLFVIITLLSGLGRSCVADTRTSTNPLFGDPYSAYTDSNW